MDSAIDAATMANLLDITGGDQGFVDELVDTYIAEGERIVGELDAAAAAGSVPDLVRPAHSLKSSSLNVGALQLGELCRQLEHDALGGAVADPVARASEVKTAFDAARAALLDERTSR
ncbi:MAG TPA: Hpt domain-containing protein [Candidatus Limnocylindrales bacterium]|nr:Hpt domain-containing protein [Candidatus Limnocylindrales bacterium]